MPKLRRRDYPYNATIHKLKCPVCEHTFYAHHSKAIYCSNLCKHKAFLMKKEKEAKQTRFIFLDYKALSDFLKKEGVVKHVLKIPKSKMIKFGKVTYSIAERGERYEVTIK
jgi:hypothetical protein